MNELINSLTKEQALIIINAPSPCFSGFERELIHIIKFRAIWRLLLLLAEEEMFDDFLAFTELEVVKNN
jgi:hypothetical protein